MREQDKIDLIVKLTQSLGKGSYRWLIYDQLGLSEKAYVPLLEAGLLTLNNESPDEGWKQE